MKIKRGDRVKLTSRAAAAFNNNMRPGQLDWTDHSGRNQPPLIAR